MKLSEATGIVEYAFNWPLSAPMDTYNAGKKHHWVVGAIMFALPGLPLMVVRFFIGWIFSVAKFAGYILSKN
jgi:hypothetical protein